MAGFPDLGELKEVLYEYNNRKFTYDENILPGIQGLMSVLSRTFVGGFLCGLPEMFLDQSLSWAFRRPELRRQTFSDRPSTSRLTPSALPSWSWAGRQSPVAIPSYEAGLIDPGLDANYSITETVPITEWFTAGTPGSPKLRRIRSTWHEYRRSFKGSSQPLPPGWTRYSSSNSDEFRNKPYPILMDTMSSCLSTKDLHQGPKIDIGTSLSQCRRSLAQRYLSCRNRRRTCSARQKGRSILPAEIPPAKATA